MSLKRKSKQSERKSLFIVNKNLIFSIVGLVIVAFVFFKLGQFSVQPTENENKELQEEKPFQSERKSQPINGKANRNLETLIDANENIPKEALEVLMHVRENNVAPDEYEGGRKFFNREQRLPKKDNQGKNISYREWDIYPKQQGKNRGAKRIVTSESTAYFTKDHYDSFILIRE